MYKHIIKDVSKHSAHYLSLLGLVLAALFGLLSFPYDKGFQSAIAVGVGVSFVVWGAVHHYLLEDHHPKVLAEYASIAFLGVTILLSVIWQV